MTTDKLSLFANSIELQENPKKGLSVVAYRTFQPGDTIAQIDGVEVAFPNPNTLEINNKHIEVDGFVRFLNHSCEPNAHIYHYKVIANKLIKNGEQITIDYLKTESKISKPFHCECGAENCCGWIE